MVVDIKSKYKEIEDDLVKNAEYVFKLRNYYSRKYAKDSNRINDVNVGLFLDDRFNPCFASLSFFILINSAVFFSSSLITTFDE